MIFLHDSVTVFAQLYMNPTCVQYSCRFRVVYPGLHLFYPLNYHDCDTDKGATIAWRKVDIEPCQNTTATKRRNLHSLRSTFYSIP